MKKAAIFNDTTATRHYGCNAVMRVLVDELHHRAIAPAYFWPVAKDWRPFADQLSKETVDLVVVNGEGSIHHSASRDRARYLCQLGRFAKDSLEVPAYLVNASITSLDHQALSDLRCFKSIWVRETESHEELQRNGIASSVVPDLSLGLPLNEHANSSLQRSGILVTDSVIEATDTILRALAARHDFRFESMRLARNTAKKAKRGFLARMQRSLAKKAGRLDILQRSLIETADHESFVGRLTGHEFVVTGRFHTVMLCLLTGVPFIAVASNTRKIQSTLLDALGSEERAVDIKEIEGNDFDDLRTRFGDWTANEKSSLDEFRRQATETRAAMFDTIARQTALALAVN